MTLFALIVLLAFLFWFLATIPGTGPWMERIARGLFLVAAVLWVFGKAGGAL